MVVQFSFEVPDVPDHLPRGHRDQEALRGRPRRVGREAEVHPSPSPSAAASLVLVVLGRRIGRRWAEKLGRARGWAALLRLDREEHLFAPPRKL